MLKIEQLDYHYPPQTMRFDTEICQGDIVAVLGPSGAGKSTLLSLVCGLIAAQNGKILINGLDITHVPAHQRPLSVLFQEHNVFNHLTVFDNIAIGLSPTLRLSEEQHTLVKEAAESVGLTAYLERLPGQLSGGQKQRVALGRCLARSQPLLLLDEPFSALDPALRRDMLQLVRSLASERQITVLMVTHHPDDAKAICNRFLYIDEGKICYSGTPDELTKPPECMAAYIGH